MFLKPELQEFQYVYDDQNFTQAKKSLENTVVNRFNQIHINSLAIVNSGI